MMLIYHVEIKAVDSRVVRGIVAKTKKEAQQLQKQLQHDPLASGCTLTIRQGTK